MYYTFVCRFLSPLLVVVVDRYIEPSEEEVTKPDGRVDRKDSRLFEQARNLNGKFSPCCDNKDHSAEN